MVMIHESLEVSEQLDCLVYYPRDRPQGCGIGVLSPGRNLKLLDRFESEIVPHEGKGS